MGVYFFIFWVRGSTCFIIKQDKQILSMKKWLLTHRWGIWGVWLERHRRGGPGSVNKRWVELSRIVPVWWHLSTISTESTSSCWNLHTNPTKMRKPTGPWTAQSGCHLATGGHIYGNIVIEVTDFIDITSWFDFPDFDLPNFIFLDFGFFRCWLPKIWRSRFGTHFSELGCWGYW